MEPDTLQQLHHGTNWMNTAKRGPQFKWGPSSMLFIFIRCVLITNHFLGHTFIKCFQQICKAHNTIMLNKRKKFSDTYKVPKEPNCTWSPFSHSFSSSYALVLQPPKSCGGDFCLPSVPRSERRRGGLCLPRWESQQKRQRFSHVGKLQERIGMLVPPLAVAPMAPGMVACRGHMPLRRR